MSWLSKQLHSAKKLVTHPREWAQNASHTVGDIARTAAPVLPFFTPLGPLGAAAIGAGGSILGGHNAKQTLKSGALGLAGGTLQQGLSGGGWNPLAVLRNPAVNSVASAAGTSGALNPPGSAIQLPENPTMTDYGGPRDPIGVPSVGGIPGIWSGGGTDNRGSHGLLGDALGWLTGSGGGGVAGTGLSPVQAALAGLEGWNAGKLGGLANQYALDASKSITDSYNQRAPLREMGIQGLTKPAPIDLSELTNIRGRIPSVPPVAPS